MNFKTLELVHKRLLEKAEDMDVEIEKYRTGELVNDEQYGRLVYKQSGIMSSVLTINDMMSEWLGQGSKEEDDMSDEVRQLVKMGR
jgi:hypothetical protein